MSFFKPNRPHHFFKSIEPFVRGAAITAAGSSAPLYCVPFPSVGQKPRDRRSAAACGSLWSCVL